MIPDLLTRDAFRGAVFARDRHRCVVCGKEGQDAHHIMERRLFDDGGYYIDNGATLCEEHHLDAEKTIISPEQLRAAVGITKAILPSHLYPDYSYDKWGNIENANGTRLKGELFFDESVQKVLAAGGVLDRFQKYVKYPRTFHLPFSEGRTDDDRGLEDLSIFFGKRIIVTAKMDGENTTGYWDGYTHARSLDSGNHPSRNYVKKYLAERLFNLPEGWRVCGENVFAKHSISYHSLPCYFLLFSIWDERNRCLSWKETIEWAALLDFKLVPELYHGPSHYIDLTKIFTPTLDGNECEGFVVRIEDSFSYGEFRRSVAKFVRKEHVQTNQHWIKTAITPNILCSSSTPT